MNEPNDIKLDLPIGTSIYPNDIVVLGRFSTVKWEVAFGWFSFDGNRNMCGWYLVNQNDTSIIKPILDIDLYDIYIIQS